VNGSWPKGTIRRRAYRYSEAKMRNSTWVACVGLGLLAVRLLTGMAYAQSVLPSDQWAPCIGSPQPAGPCNPGPRGGLNPSPGGGLYAGPGGGLYPGPGGGLYPGPGGGMYPGPGGGLYPGPGGGAYPGPGGGLNPGPVGASGYKGPWSPCFTGVFGAAWRKENCPGFGP
jgi:hypothetical protein